MLAQRTAMVSRGLRVVGTELATRSRGVTISLKIDDNYRLPGKAPLAVGQKDLPGDRVVVYRSRLDVSIPVHAAA